MNLAATLSPDEIARELWDIVVVGAGPAGSSAARAAAARGASVLLVDKSHFPRTKVCGCCLNARGIASLKASGFDSLTSLGAIHQRSIIISARGRHAALPLPNTFSLSRETLDAQLIHRAILAGTSFLPNAQASLVASDPEFQNIRLQLDEATIEVRAKIVLAADGLAGRFATHQLGGAVESRSSRIGLGAICNFDDSHFSNHSIARSLDHSIFMACAPGGYVGLARVEGNRLAIGAALDPAFLREAGSPAAAVRHILSSALDFPLPILETLPWRGTPPLTRRPRRVAGHRLFTIGDAAGYVEPFTGEGMAWALAAGEAVAPLALRAAENWSPSLYHDWSTLHRRLVARRQTLCRLLTLGLRSPAVTSVAIALASSAPGMARRIIDRLNKTDSFAPMEATHP